MSLTSISLVLIKSLTTTFDIIYNMEEDPILVERDNWEHDIFQPLCVKSQGTVRLIPDEELEALQLVLKELEDIRDMDISNMKDNCIECDSEFTGDGLYCLQHIHLG